MVGHLLGTDQPGPAACQAPFGWNPFAGPARCGYTPPSSVPNAPMRRHHGPANRQRARSCVPHTLLRRGVMKRSNHRTRQTIAWYLGALLAVPGALAGGLPVAGQEREQAAAPERTAKPATAVPSGTVEVRLVDDSTIKVVLSE